MLQHLQLSFAELVPQEVRHHLILCPLGHLTMLLLCYVLLAFDPFPLLFIVVLPFDQLLICLFLVICLRDNTDRGSISTCYMATVLFNGSIFFFGQHIQLKVILSYRSRLLFDTTIKLLLLHTASFRYFSSSVWTLK